jgi:tRNA(Ile)-lysidine synthase
VLRTYQKGDYFYPYGLNKKKKLSDYFQEKKLNLPERESALVLTQSDKIICLIGFQIDHRFMVTRQTKKVLRIHVQKKFT